MNRTQAAARAVIATDEMRSRFWLHVNKEGDCWIWTGVIDPQGYGRLNIHDQSLLAHRVSFAVHYGVVPIGKHVLHACDNPPCVNPSHLRLGTHADNMADAAAKGRTNRIGRKGITNPLAKLTDELVMEARRRWSDGETSTALALEYGVSSSTLLKAIRGEKWAHIPGVGQRADLSQATVCPNGHPYTKGAFRLTKTGLRICLPCKTAYARQYRLTRVYDPEQRHLQYLRKKARLAAA